MRNWKWAVAILTALPILILFQNCGREFRASGSATSLSFCKLQAAPQSPFVSSKVRIRKTFFSAQQKLASQSTKLSIVVDVKCMEDTGDEHKFFLEDVRLRSGHRGMKKAALTLSISGEPSVDEIEQELEKDPCYLGIAENLNIQRTQTATAQPVNDPQATVQAHLNFVSHTNSRPLQAEITSNVVVAIIDSGVDYNHPDLSSRMWDDGNGNPGYNYIALNNAPLDDDGHGTHVAGIVAAEEDNSFAVAGLASGYVQLMAVKVLDRFGAGTSQDVYNGIQYAIRNNADIINLSVESLGRNSLMEDALTDAVNAGIIVTAATGNASSEISANNLFAPAYIGPGLGGVISVASVDTQGAGLSIFSNYSSTFAELSAPGAENSTQTQGGILSTNLGGGWTRIRGTSQATPMVTAAAALLIGYLKSNNVSYTPGGIESFLKSDGSMVNPTLVPYIAEGRIINMGFLSRNLTEVFAQPGAATQTLFNGDQTTGNTCIID